MPAPSPLPKYVYKIIDTEPPSPLPASYPPSELDAKDGFIHLSTAQQIPTTASLFFASHTQMWLIKIRLAGIAAATTWDDDNNTAHGCYPHLHGRSFGPGDVAGVRRFERRGAEQQAWKEVFAASEWLE